MKRSALMIFAGLIALCAVSPVRAAETLGDIGVSGLLLEPSFRFEEPRRGQFDVGRSYLAVTWTRDPSVSASIKLGSRSLIGKPARYGPAATDDIAVIEAYAQLESAFGRIRAGLVPLPYGWEGGDSEHRLSLPRSQLFRNRIVNIRDHGVSYHVGFEGYFSDWAIHNGEGGPDLDNDMWFTLRSGWEGARFLRLGLSGTTGSTNAASTNLTPATWTSADAGLSIGERAKIRIANAFLNWEVNPIEVTLEATAGNTFQDSGDRELRAVHLDLNFVPNESVSWLTRYDIFDPSTAPNDRSDEYTLGLAWKGKYRNSVLYVLGSKQVLENVPLNVHKAEIIWRMTPSANSFRSPL
ncbi:MAG: hypothetical protein AAB250_10805 [Bdellovibrionota bacterium]